jgi:hypothetical protein
MIHVMSTIISIIINSILSIIIIITSGELPTVAECNKYAVEINR